MKNKPKNKKNGRQEALIFSIAGKYGVDFLNDGANTTLAGASATTEGFNQAAKVQVVLQLKLYKPIITVMMFLCL